MTYAPSSPSFSLFPTAPSAPHAFTIFSMSQSPRETHALFEDLVSVFRPTAAADPRGILSPPNSQEKSLKRCKSSPSLKKTWRKWFGREVPEPEFEFITAEGKLSTPESEDDLDSLDESLVDEEFGVLGKELSEKSSTLGSEDDGASSDGTLVDEPIIIVTTPEHSD